MSTGEFHSFERGWPDAECGNHFHSERQRCGDHSTLSSRQHYPKLQRTGYSRGEVSVSVRAPDRSNVRLTERSPIGLVR